MKADTGSGPLIRRSVPGSDTIREDRAMHLMLLTFAFLSSSQATASPSGQTPAPAAAQAPATAPAEALSTQMPLEALMAIPAARAIILEVYPNLDQNPMYEQLKSRSLRAIVPIAGGTITNEQLDGIDARLRAIH